MIRATGAKLRMLASDVLSCFLAPDAQGEFWESDEEEARDMIGLLSRWHIQNSSVLGLRLMSGQIAVHARVIDM